MTTERPGGRAPNPGACPLVTPHDPGGVADQTLLERAMPPPPRRDRVDGHTATLPASPGSAATARQFLRQVLSPRTSAQERATVELLTTELVANAVVHARSSCDVRVTERADGSLRVEVTDGADGTPARQAVAPTDATGRGLLLVDGLAARWGTSSTETGKTVWFETGQQTPAG